MFLLDVTYDSKKLVGRETAQERIILKSAATTLLEALRKAASQELQIDYNEINGGWMSRTDSDGMLHLELFFYDNLTSGAGYSSLIGSVLDKILLRARAILSDCECSRACKNCLDNYYNQRSHEFFDRHEEANRTDYDKLADTLKSNSHNDAKIEVYIFRDNINSETLAWLINCSKERNANGLVEVFPLCRFFEKLFSSEEYSSFSEYANEFISRCNSVISYKTVITPTQRTLSMFKLKKAQMLSKLDYKSIAAKGQSGELSDAEFSKVKTNFLNKRMYTAMISSNDFADSFISAEWAFDIYSNSMGELELTGIIAGYLKSIEQLMYTVARFHRDQGLKIRTKRGYQPYTAANEHAIDSTLNSLNEFLTSPKAKLAITRNIRGCIKEAVDTWRQYQRNGYFHKDNLYSSDNKIFEVRELTLYLYFVILGGISFSSEELQLLGIAKCQDINKHHFDEKSDYTRFCRWFDGIIMYDLPEKVPGLWLLMTHNADTWEAKPFLMKYFYIDEFESNTCEFVPEQIDLNPVREITAFTWNETNEDMIQASLQFGKLFARYREDHPEKIKQIMAIILGADKMTQLLYFRENN